MRRRRRGQHANSPALGCSRAGNTDPDERHTASGRRGHGGVGRGRAGRRARLRQARRARRAAGARRAGAAGRGGRGAGAWGRGARAAHRRRRRRAVEAAAARVEERFGPHRRLGQRRDGDRCSRASPTQRRGVHARATEVTYLGTVYGTMAALQADERARPRHDRPGRLGARPTARSRCRPSYCGAEVRDPRLHRLHAHRADARRQLGVGSRWCSCPASTRRSSTGVAAKLPQHPKPVPPIYQPEVPAEAVYWAAHHRRRELVGRVQRDERHLRQQARRPDRGLGTSPRTGFDSQQMPTARSAADRPDNLFDPVRRASGDARHLRRPGQVAQPAAVGDAPTARLLGCGRSPAAGLAAAGLATMGALADATCAARVRAAGRRRARSLVGPRGDIAWMCFPRWDSGALFVRPDRRLRRLRGDPPRRATCGAATTSRRADLAQPLGHRRRHDVECREALALPAPPSRAVILRRIARRGRRARCDVVLDPRRRASGATR